MNFFIKLLLTALVFFVSAEVFPGISISGGYGLAIWIAIVVGLLNALLRPILVLLTLPATLLTLGAFLVVINAFVLQVADWLMDKFTIDHFGWALLLAIILSLLNSWIDNQRKQKRRLRNEEVERGPRVEGKTIYIDAEKSE